MAKIRILSETLANQIAAGEVVERPASVVKELLENAIDASAKRIEIDIESGGRRLIRIADDGEGMMRDDAILAFERHATSKISRPEDLVAINTLGFRGEALASISSVARVEMVTKTDFDLAATRVRFAGGTLVDISDAARDRGTTVAVRDLFFNTPARRKFLRSEATENFHITGIVTHYALVNPEIAFRLTNNGRLILETPEANTVRERAFQIFGGGLLESLIPISGGREYVAQISGLVSAPRERRTNRDSQYFFVNRRFVRDKAIADALKHGYRSVLPHGFYPVAFLFLEVPAEEVDVNVHPAKTEVRFRRPDAVKDVIAEAVRAALANAGIRLSSDDVFRDNFGSSPSQSELKENVGPSTTIRTADGGTLEPVRDSLASERSATAAERLFARDATLLADAPQIYRTERDIVLKRDSSSASEMDSPLSPATASESQAAPALLPPILEVAHFLVPEEPNPARSEEIRAVGQLHNSYIIAADNEGLLLIDQHVAHERILFDKFRDREADLPSQNLLLPETVDLSPAQAEIFDLAAEELERLGFKLMRLSGRTVAVKAVPADLSRTDARTLLSDILDNVERGKGDRGSAVIRDSIAASMACKAAIKVNNPLSAEEMDWLISRLLFTSSPTTCPHGRPVILRLSVRGIERAFERI
ncbi:MAG: DNA mismatch repair protein MutL [Blastocatellia bacterium]